MVMPLGEMIFAALALAFCVFMLFILMILVIAGPQKKSGSKLEKKGRRLVRVQQQQNEDTEENTQQKNRIIDPDYFKVWLLLCFLPIGAILLSSLGFKIKDMQGSWQFYREKQKNLTVLEHEISVQQQHLEQACQTESKISVYHKIPKNQGLLISKPPLDMREASEASHEEQQALEQCTNEIIKLNQRHGTTVSDQHFCRQKYLSSPALFRSHAIANSPIAREEGLFSYVEVENRPDNFVRYAETSWWVDADLADTAYAFLQKDKRQFQNKSLEEIRAWFEEKKIANLRIFAIPVSQPLAPYRLETSDISTLADRHKGLRRARFALFDNHNDRLLAEYISFDLASLIHVSPKPKSQQAYCSRGKIAYTGALDMELLRAAVE